MSTPAPPPPPPSAEELGAALSATTLDSSAAPGAPAVDLVALAASVTAQGDAVRELKRAGAAKGEVTAAVDKLKLLKIMLANGGVNPEVAAAAAKAKAATVPKRVFAKEPEVLVSDANLDGAEAYGKFYITTAINYANGPPHMGHAYEGLMTDTVARYHRIAGRKVFFLTGADEHGQKIANTAEREGLKPVEICDKYVAMFKHLNTRMRVSNDDYQRTTDPKHEDTCRELWKKCHANGDIYLHTYVGWYLEREEMFIKESDAKEWEYKDPQSGVPLKEMEETCYFFKLSKYQDKLVDLITNDPTFVQPADRRAQILKMLEEPLADLCVSRTTFQWGITMPEGFDQKHVMYVWFDALTNYLSGVNGLDPDHPLASMWPADAHVIGKDITRFHCIYWPAMLMSAGLPLPKTVLGHGFISAADGRKMSKSFGNVIDPHDMLDKFPNDSFRYYLVKEAFFGADLRFSEDALRLAHNSELADTVGNLVSRATNLSKGLAAPSQLPPPPPASVHAEECAADPMPFDLAALRDAVAAKMAVFDTQGALYAAMEAAREVNRWLYVAEPWKLKKDEDQVRRAELIRRLLEAVYALTHFLVPFMPVACTLIFEQLGCPPRPLHALSPAFDNLAAAAGSPVTVGGILFPKLLSDEEMIAAAAGKDGKASKPAKGKPAKAKAPAEDQDAWSKMDIKVGTITKVWAHPTADKLWCEEISVGGEAPLAVASGLREVYTESEMMGRRVLVICNLKPTKMMGFQSCGMVLAAKDASDAVALVEAPAGATDGDRVRADAADKGDAEMAPPLSASQVKKRKAWEAVAAKLATDAAGVACFDGVPLRTAAGQCPPCKCVGSPIA